MPEMEDPKMVIDGATKNVGLVTVHGFDGGMVRLTYTLTGFMPWKPEFIDAGWISKRHQHGILF